MSVVIAREILGVRATSTEQEIRAAYNNLMRRVHPDVGGSEFFSKQLNAARTMLIRDRAAAASGRRNDRKTKRSLPAPYRILTWFIIVIAIFTSI